MGDQLIGMYDLTCVDLGRPHSLEALLKAKVEELPSDVRTDFWDLAAEWWIAQEQAERSCKGDEDDDYLEQESSLLPPFGGIGFSHTLALTNHSCFPNIYIDQETSCELVAKTRRPIALGEQIVSSYIELLANPVERQQKLLDEYGFACVCIRC